MPVVAVVGLQWGDEGKGKVIDLFAEAADTVVRHGGGANAGHTLRVGDETFVVHLLPSGVLHPKTECILAQGMVLDLSVLLEEIDLLESRGVEVLPRLYVSNKAHVVLPHHKAIDAAREAQFAAIGTTKRGIGPAYEDKVGRRGIRVEDCGNVSLLTERLDRNLRGWEAEALQLGVTLPSVGDLVTSLRLVWERLAPRVVATDERLWSQIEEGRKILLEGAQGALLDIDDGTYPYVTSSHVSAAAACAYAGLPAQCLDRVVGVTKAYCTRVGEGPFPTELDEGASAQLRTLGGEFGATTGRPRRCGWLDLDTLRRTCRRNGIDALVVTKLDVLDTLDSVGVKRAAAASDEGLVQRQGWSSPTHNVRNFAELPEQAASFLRLIESDAATPLMLTSVGPERHSNIGETDCFKGLPAGGYRRPRYAF